MKGEGGRQRTVHMGRGTEKTDPADSYLFFLSVSIENMALM